MIARKRYDAVVTDIRMPVLNGHALIVSLLEEAERPFIVAVTAVDEPKIVKDLVTRGVDDIVQKPVDHSWFVAKLTATLARRCDAANP